MKEKATDLHEGAPKAPVSPQIAKKIRKIGLGSMKAKKELKSLAGRFNLDERQVLAIVHAKSADEMLDALVREED